MTEKQAIFLRSCFSNGIEFRKDMAIINEHPFSQDELDELAMVFDDAIKKQIAVKPIYSENQGVRYTSVWECPTCGGSFTGMRLTKHCYHCGQKFDWEVE